MEIGIHFPESGDFSWDFFSCFLGTLWCHDVVYRLFDALAVFGLSWAMS